MSLTTNENGTAPGRFHWHGTIAPGSVVEIVGRNGDVRAESNNSGEIDLVAQKYGPAALQHEVEIEVREHSQGVTISAVYREDDAPDRFSWEWVKYCLRRLGRSDVRVDFVVGVPPGVRFVCRSANGGIKALLNGNDIEVQTVNGGIKIDTNGYAQAQSVNGSIEATFGSLNWPGPLLFQTSNGNITLNAPAGMNARLSAKTNRGKITSEFPLTAATEPKSGRQMAGLIGSGGDELTLKTVNGSVSLRRAIQP